MAELKVINLSIKEYVDGKKVSKKINPQKLGKLDLSLSELKSIFLTSKDMTVRDNIIAAYQKKNEDLSREVIKASLAYKETIVYFEDLTRALDKLITKYESLSVMRNRITFKGKGSNYRTYSERCESILN